MNVTAFDHVNLRTSRIEEMIRWYGDILGLRQGKRPAFDGPGAWLYLGDQAIVHLVDVDTNPEAGDNLSLEHFALRAEDMDAFTQHLEARDVPYRVAPVPGFGITQININDPDGNHIHVDFVD
ncbi:MAG: VOC family protein [Paracoccaceae bacterium]